MAAATGNERRPADTRRCAGTCSWYDVDERRRWQPGAPPSPLLAVPNVTAHPSTASVPITVLLYNDPLLCGFNVPLND